MWYSLHPCWSRSLKAQCWNDAYEDHLSIQLLDFSSGIIVRITCVLSQGLITGTALNLCSGTFYAYCLCLRIIIIFFFLYDNL